MRLRGERGGSEELWSHRVEKWDILVIIKAGKKVVKRSLKGRFSLVGDLEHFLICFLDMVCVFFIAHIWSMQAMGYSTTIVLSSLICLMVAKAW